MEVSDQIKISCDKSNLSKVRAFVDQTLQKEKIDDLEVHKMILAVDEICANLIIHANHCNPDEYLELNVDVVPDSKVEIVIVDKGIGFDISHYQEPELAELITKKRKGGLGLMLVKRIMDKIEFKEEDHHNICRLVKYLKSNTA